MNAATRGLWHAVYDRSEGLCDLCGLTVGFEGPWAPHHRKLRAQGGTDNMANLLLLCAHCHLPRVHLRAEWAYVHGFLLRSGSDPELTPVCRFDGWHLPGVAWKFAPGAATHHL